jgi:hypothetical protein
MDVCAGIGNFTVIGSYFNSGNVRYGYGIIIIFGTCGKKQGSNQNRKGPIKTKSHKFAFNFEIEYSIVIVKAV